MIPLQTFNPNTPTGAGWCLQYARTSFGAPAVEPSAWQAWVKTKHKHGVDEKLPNVPTPVWFSHWGTYQGIYGNWGHVVVYVPGQGFWSSPYTNTTKPALLKTIADVERLFNSKYVGWSEDISGVRVMKPAPKPDKPIFDPVNPIQKEDDDGMYRPTVHVRTQGNFEAMRAHPEIGKDLKPGQKRKDGNVTVFRGYEVTTNQSVAKAWARTHSRGFGQETSRTNRADYIAIQKEAQRISVEIVG